MYNHGQIYTSGGAWAAFSSEAVEAHPTLEYKKKMTRHMWRPLVVEAPGELPN